jgi:hypothetical protein
MVAVVMGQFVQLTPRGKTHYHEDLVVTEGGAAKDFTGWTDFELEMKAPDDESGAAIMTAVVAIANPPGADGLLDLDVTEAATTAAQNADPQVLEGIYDLRAKDGAGEYQLIMYGTWRLTPGVSDV